MMWSPYPQWITKLKYNLIDLYYTTVNLPLTNKSIIISSALYDKVDMDLTPLERKTKCYTISFRKSNHKKPKTAGGDTENIT